MSGILSALSLVRVAILGAYCALVVTGNGWWAVPLLVLFILPVSKAPAVAVTVAK